MDPAPQLVKGDHEAAPAPPPAPRINRLAIRIGPASYLVEMTSVGEIVPLPAVTPVPWTQPWFRGLANVRGRLVGVYDLQQLTGAPAMTEDEAQQLMVVNAALKTQAALLVTRAFGLRDLNQLERLPRSDSARLWEGVRYRDADGTLLTELDLVRLLADDSFGAIGA
jgi:twitching motility protein PilI